MGSEWPRILLEDGPLKIFDGDRGKNYPKRTEFKSSGHCVFLNTGNVTQRGFEFGSTDFVSEERDSLLGKGKLQREDVVLTTRGTVGNSAYYDAEIPYDHVRINSGMVILRSNVDILFPRFLYLFVRSQTFSEQVSALQSGSAQPQLPIRDLRRFEIPLPPLPEQKAIAHILGSLDDKIELNRRMNATLEGMAQALFKSWFVDFDPVIDNALAAGNPIPDELADRAEVRRQALANATANREAAKPFPAAFELTESMGWIPEGWENQALYDIANFVNGASYKGADFSDSPEALPVVKIAEVKAGITAQTKFTEINKGTRYRIDTGDILLSWSGNPDTSIDTFIWTDGPGYLNQHIFNVCLHDESERYFVYYQLKHLRATFVEIARDKQTTGLGHFTAGDMKRLMVFKATAPLLEQFNAAVSSIYSRGYGNRLATKTLTKLRDTLLPKLISGELRLPEANQLTEEALT